MVSLRDVGMQALLRLAALIEESLEGARGNRACRDVRSVEHEVEEYLVEVVPAEPTHPGRREDLVAALAHAHERRVEGPAAEIVDHDVLATLRERVAVTVRVLETRRGRFVQQRARQEAGATKRVERDEARRGVRVRGHGDHRVEGV